MRVFALSNEPRPGADPDIPWALSRLHHEGLVEDFKVYSTPAQVSHLGVRGAAAELAEIVHAFCPDVLAFFHSGSCLLDDDGLDGLRRAWPAAVWMYHEGDPFRRWAAPYPRRALPTLRRCQAAFPFAGGYIVDLVRRAGCALVSYAPSWVNPERFPHVWRSSGPFAYDVVFIGNNVHSRVRRFPGARARSELVERLQRRYGRSFALFGRGWSGPNAMGPCSFDDVSDIYTQARVCVGIDHAVGPFQFSNRLPIALASGIPLVHSWFPGADVVLAGLEHSAFFSTPDQATSLIDQLLDMNEDQLTRVSANEREVAARFSCDRVLAYMLETAASVRSEAPVRPRNPWVGERDFS